MTIPEFLLRPLTTGELLDRAFSLYRRNFWKFAGALAVVQVIVTGLQIVSPSLNWLTTASWMSEDTKGFAKLASYFALFLFGFGSDMPIGLSFIKMVIFDCLGTGALVYLIIHANSGNSLSILQAYRQTLKLSLKLVGARVYAGIVFIFTTLLATFSIIGWLPLPGVIFLFAGTIIPMITIPIVVEGQPMTMAFTRMTELVMKRFWWIEGIIGVLFLLSIIILSIQTAISTGISKFILGPTADQLITGGISMRFVLTQVLSMAGALVVYPFQVTVYILAYLDLRIRFEGLDLILATELMSRESQNQAETIFSLPTPAASSSYNTNWKNLGALTIFGWALIFVFLIFFWLLPIATLFQ